MNSSSALSSDTALRVLLAVIARSPIIVRPILTGMALRLTDWAAVRKSGHADAFVLAWIASHVRGARRRPRVFM
jgi:hypothetical protein